MRELVIDEARAARHGPRAAPGGNAELRRVFADDVRRGLSLVPKRLDAKYFYDALGSQLFEAICHLPWYRITRAERRLLARDAPAILAPLPDLAAMVELGCGNGGKLALLGEALRQRGAPLRVHLVDISPTALELSERTLARLPHVAVAVHRATYATGLAAAVAGRPPRGRLLVLFLGSNIGNLHPAEATAFAREIRRTLRPGDGFLLGADLVKSEAELLLAYGDPLGVTAAFNKNLLVRINRELGGDFDVDAFDHRAVWNPAAARVESHLVSRRPQRVRVPDADLDVRLDEGESIWTESSYKYTAAGILELIGAAGFHASGQWIDDDAGFALTLFIAGA
jgi:dimethylhistidine N-methyltransferase